MHCLEVTYDELLLNFCFPILTRGLYAEVFLTSDVVVCDIPEEVGHPRVSPFTAVYTSLMTRAWRVIRHGAHHGEPRLWLEHEMTPAEVASDE